MDGWKRRIIDIQNLYTENENHMQQIDTHFNSMRETFNDTLTKTLNMTSETRSLCLQFKSDCFEGIGENKTKIMEL